MKKLLCLLLVFVLSGCSLDTEDLSYKKGNHEYDETISSIVIEWPEGNIEINQQQQDCITIVEEASRDLEKKEEVRSKIEDGVLIIKYCKSDVTIDDISKDLTITVPDTAELKTVEYNGENALLLIWETEVSDKITFTSETGALEVDLLETVNEIEVSGDGVGANLNVTDVQKISAKTVTGNICVNIQGEVDEMDLSSESGSVALLTTKKNFTLDTPNKINDLKTELEYTEQDGKLVFGEGGSIYNITLGEESSLSVFYSGY